MATPPVLAWSLPRLVRMAEQEIQTVAEQVARGRVTRSEEEHRQPDQLVMGKEACIRRRGELGEEIVPLGVAFRPYKRAEELLELEPAFVRPFDQLLGLWAPRRVDQTCELADVRGPPVKVGDVLFRYADQLADHRERQPECELVDEVDVLAFLELSHDAPNARPDPRSRTSSKSRIDQLRARPRVVGCAWAGP